MLFKAYPDDFIVEEEIFHNVIKKSGEHTLFLVRKENITTIELVREIAQIYRIGHERISFAGLKDKKSISYQYISIKNFNTRILKGRNFKGERKGFLSEPIQPKHIKRNKFEIILRKGLLKYKTQIQRRLEEIKEYGYPNYFDIQRMGHALKGRGFFLKNILLGNYKRALLLYFHTLSDEGKSRLKKFKKNLKFNSFNYKNLISISPSRDIREMLQELINGTDEREVLKKIPEFELKILGEGYMSYLWNRAVILFLKRIGITGYRHRHPVNTLFFYRKLNKKILEILIQSFFTIPCNNLNYYNKLFLECMGMVLKKEGFKDTFFPDYPSDFPVRLRPYKRPICVIPENLSYDFTLAPPFYNIKLKFALASGSYATVFLKSLISYEKIISKKND